MKPFKLGLIVNPYAGIGGALALKGSDGKEIREQALAMGAEKKANDKARIALQEILSAGHPLQIYTASDEMGESVCQSLNAQHQVVYVTPSTQSEAQDTIDAAKAMLANQIDILLFAGGDGTARNIFDAVDNQCPVLGIPAGCKIHSGVYAITPKSAGRVINMLISGEIVSLNEAEVKDIDEAQFRQGKVQAKYYGEMRVPTELRYVQAVKMGGKESEELVLADIAAHIMELMRDHPDTNFIMGSGSTIDYIMQDIGIDNTLLGVDVVRDQQLIVQDATAQQLLDVCQHAQCKLIITLIGGQGHILGRGNQQLSPQLVRQIGKQNIIVVSTKSKLQSLQGRPLISDSGDQQLDQTLSGMIAVVTGYKDQVLYPINNLQETE